MSLLLHFFGLDSASGPVYLFWSGAGSDVSELTVVAALLAVYRRHNCHVRGCWRIGRVPFTDPGSGVAYLLCRRHHPVAPGRAPSPGDVAAMQRRALADRGARHRRREGSPGGTL